MPTIEEIITDVIKREGPETNDPLDKGGRTAFGISEKSNPAAWADNVVTEEEARALYEKKYVEGPGFKRIHDPYLKTQLIDYGVNSGPQLAIMELQKILKVTVDGSIGPETLGAIDRVDNRHLNNMLVRARVKMFGRIVKKDISQVRFLEGWLDRALQFLL